MSEVKTHLSLKLAKEELELHNEILEQKVYKRTKELELTQETTIENLLALLNTEIRKQADI